MHTCARYILNQLQVFQCCSAMPLKMWVTGNVIHMFPTFFLNHHFDVWHLAHSSSGTVSIYRLAIRLNNFIKPVRCNKCIIGQIWSGAYFPYLNAANDLLEMPVSRLTTSILCVFLLWFCITRLSTIYTFTCPFHSQHFIFIGKNILLLRSIAPNMTIIISFTMLLLRVRRCMTFPFVTWSCLPLSYYFIMLLWLLITSHLLSFVSYPLSVSFIALHPANRDDTLRSALALNPEEVRHERCLGA